MAEMIADSNCIIPLSGQADSVRLAGGLFVVA
jgi:hypothetical protein